MLEPKELANMFITNMFANGSLHSSIRDGLRKQLPARKDRAKFVKHCLMLIRRKLRVSLDLKKRKKTKV